MSTAEKEVTQELERVSEQQDIAVPQQNQQQIQAKQAHADRMIELAITSGADPAYMDKLLDLKHRHEAEEARRAFTDALAAFKSESIQIIKDRKAGFEHRDGGGRTEYSYASLGNIIEIAVHIHLPGPEEFFGPQMRQHIDGRTHKTDIGQRAVQPEAFDAG